MDYLFMYLFIYLFTYLPIVFLKLNTNNRLIVKFGQAKKKIIDGFYFLFFIFIFFLVSPKKKKRHRNQFTQIHII